MLPRLIANSSSIIRAHAIGELLRSKNYDVIVFQEAFSSKPRKIIWDYLKSEYPYSTGPANQKDISLKTNSGIWIISKYPIKYFKSMAFKFRVGWDAFSRKGALLLELDVDGMVVQIVGTHLQNSGGSSLREAQCSELYKRLLEPNRKDGVPQIICGDFNINRYSSSYSVMLETLNAVDGELASEGEFSYDFCSNDLNGGKSIRSLIDYILIGNGGAWSNGAIRNIISFKKRWSPTHQDLSDHYAIEASVELTPKATASNIAVETSQQNPITKKVEPIKPQLQSLYFSPEYQLVNLDRQITPMIGASLSLKISDKWNAGIIAIGMLGDYSPRQISTAKALNLNVKLLGLKFEYVLQNKNLFHFTFPLEIGVGEAKIDSADGFNNHINYDLDKHILWKRSFLWVQPGINIETKLTKFSKMFVGIGYRILVERNDVRLTTTDVRNKWNGPTINVGLKLRIFDYSSK